MKGRQIYSMKFIERFIRIYPRASNSKTGFYLRWLVGMIRKSTSINGIDKELLRYLPRTPGFFVEVGGNDGINQSNTFILEKIHGWNGLLVEPVPRLAQLCAKSRSKSIVKNMALVAPENVGNEIAMIDLGLMTFVNGGPDQKREKQIQYGIKHTGRNPKIFQISGDTLSNVLLSIGNPQIDFLSLDVEGYEAEVLKGLDFSIHKPKLILVETKSHPEIIKMLGKQYVLIAQLSHHDYLYRLND